MAYRLTRAQLVQLRGGKRPRRPSRDLEHQEQAALFEWVRLKALVDHRLRNCFAIPNGGHRHVLTAIRLRDEGVEPGVPDVCLAWPAGRYHGLWIEMKSKQGRASAKQLEWRERLRAAGYCVAECRSCEEAIVVIEGYLCCA